MAKVKVKAKEFVADVRAGLKDSDLRDKYDLSDRQLGKLFEKLLDQGRLKPSDLDDKSHVFEATLELASTCANCGSLILVETKYCPNCERTLDLSEIADAPGTQKLAPPKDGEPEETDTREDHTVRLDGLEFDLFQAENAQKQKGADLETDETEPVSQPDPTLDGLLENVPDEQEYEAPAEPDLTLSQTDLEPFDDVDEMGQPAGPELDGDSLVLDDLEFDLDSRGVEDFNLDETTDPDASTQRGFDDEPLAGDTLRLEDASHTDNMEDPEFELVLPDHRPHAPSTESRTEEESERAAGKESLPTSVLDTDLLSSDSLAIESLDESSDDELGATQVSDDSKSQPAHLVKERDESSEFSAKRLIRFAVGTALAATIILVIAGFFTGMIPLPSDVLPNPNQLFSTFFQGEEKPETVKPGVELRTKAPRPEVTVARESRPAENKPAAGSPAPKTLATKKETNRVAIIEEASGELYIGQPVQEAGADLHVTVKSVPKPPLPESQSTRSAAAPPFTVARNRLSDDRVEPKGGRQLILAIRDGDLEQVKNLLDNGTDVDTRDERGLTAIMTAIENGSEPMTSLLLNSGADIELDTKNGSNALRLACESGKVGLVKLLIARNKLAGAGLLLDVSRKGRTDWVRLLLEAGAPIDTRDAEGNTGLMLASGNGRLEVVRLMLEKGADVRLRNKKGVNALGWARAPIAKNYVSLPIRREMVRLLKEYARGRGNVSQQH